MNLIKILLMLVPLFLSLLSHQCFAEDSKLNSNKMQNFYGNWIHSPVQSLPTLLSKSCSDGEYSITPEFISMKSGALVIKASYMYELTGDTLVIYQTNLTHNEKQNCQGYTAEFVIKNYVKKIEFKLVGQLLRIYLDLLKPGYYVDLVKVKDSKDVPFAVFRSKDQGASFDISIEETERFARYSRFVISSPIRNEEEALFVFCSFSEFVRKRGFTHFAIMEPKAGDNVASVGLFNSASEDMGSVFGDDSDLTRVVGKYPGAVEKLNKACGR